MVVAISKDVLDLREKLSELGYTVVVLGEYNYPIDAMIYTEYTPEISYISSNNIPVDNYGILMINAKNKDIEDIDKILKRKVYNPLF